MARRALRPQRGRGSPRQRLSLLAGLPDGDDSHGGGARRDARVVRDRRPERADDRACRDRSARLLRPRPHRVRLPVGRSCRGRSLRRTRQLSALHRRQRGGPRGACDARGGRGRRQSPARSARQGGGALRIARRRHDDGVPDVPAGGCDLIRAGDGGPPDPRSPPGFGPGRSHRFGGRRRSCRRLRTRLARQERHLRESRLRWAARQARRRGDVGRADRLCRVRQAGGAVCAQGQLSSVRASGRIGPRVDNAVA